jgi:hypothetical protein
MEQGPRAILPLQPSAQIQAVENERDRKGHYQDQYQRIDAHATAPTVLLVGDMGTEKSPGILTTRK